MFSPGFFGVVVGGAGIGEQSEKQKRKEGRGKGEEEFRGGQKKGGEKRSTKEGKKGRKEKE